MTASFVILQTIWNLCIDWQLRSAPQNIEESEVDLWGSVSVGVEMLAWAEKVNAESAIVVVVVVVVKAINPVRKKRWRNSEQQEPRNKYERAVKNAQECVDVIECLTETPLLHYLLFMFLPYQPRRSSRHVTETR